MASLLTKPFSEWGAVRGHNTLYLFYSPNEMINELVISFAFSEIINEPKQPLCGTPALFLILPALFLIPFSKATIIDMKCNTCQTVDQH